jgi:hypothetical protein
MQKLKLWLLTAAFAVLAACGGGSDETLTGGGAGGPGGGAAEVGSVRVLTSSPQIPSDGAATATITALVLDPNNNVMADVPVLLSASSGSLAVSQPLTDENGSVTATLSTAGDPSNRAITVTGKAGDASASVTVSVIGTVLTITGPSSLALNSTESYTVVLTNAGSKGIANRNVTITSALGNGISQSPVVTDAQGRASFNVTASIGGTDTISAAALGITTPKTVVVSNDAFTFSAPAVNTEIPLGTNATITVNYSQGATGVAGVPIEFSTTRGTVSSAQAITDASGNATVTVTAANAGPALLTARIVSNGTTIQRAVEFVATVPATLDLQASPFTVATNDQSTITAIVRDPAGNLVKNQTVNFVLDDTSNGSLSVAQAVTNSQGRAQTFYNASSSTSAVNGVRIDATVSGTAVTDFVQLTVAKREVFISLGTGNEIEEPNTAQYRKEWIIQVTDAQGNGVNQVPVSVSILSERYWEGVRLYADPPGAWVTQRGVNALPDLGCPDEDINANPIFDRNGVLDAGEDVNMNGRIEAGNIATVVAQAGGGSTVTTDANGFALVDVYYPQEYAYWLEVTLAARASVQGTEFVRSTTFILEGLASDFQSENNSPPGLSSPFGTDGQCNTPPPPLGP